MGNWPVQRLKERLKLLASLKDNELAIVWASCEGVAKKYRALIKRFSSTSWPKLKSISAKRRFKVAGLIDSFSAISGKLKLSRISDKRVPAANPSLYSLAKMYNGAIEIALGAE